jgi:hypothetical protein
MLGCAVMIAVCVVLTVLIVSIARDRRPSSGVVLTDVAPVALLGAGEPLIHTDSAHASNVAVVITRSTPNPGAPASEGAHP